jgi:hypothetical protein
VNTSNNLPPSGNEATTTTPELPFDATPLRPYPHVGPSFITCPCCGDETLRIYPNRNWRCTTCGYVEVR